MDKLIFEPWIGPNYGKPPFGKLLIIGESHYTGEEEYTESTDFTTKIVQEYIDDEGKIVFFSNMGSTLDQNDAHRIWDNVAFANGIQRGLTDAKSQPTKEDIDTVIPAFWMLVEKLTPSKVVICSSRMWKGWMPDNDERSSLVNKIAENGRYSNVWKYRHSGGHCWAIGINHPSSPGFSPNEWRPLVKKFLFTDYT